MLWVWILPHGFPMTFAQTDRQGDEVSLSSTVRGSVLGIEAATGEPCRTRPPCPRPVPSVHLAGVAGPGHLAQRGSVTGFTEATVPCTMMGLILALPLGAAGASPLPADATAVVPVSPLLCSLARSVLGPDNHQQVDRPEGGPPGAAGWLSGRASRNPFSFGLDQRAK